jgi:hypothetical protein
VRERGTKEGKNKRKERIAFLWIQTLSAPNTHLEAIHFMSSELFIIQSFLFDTSKEIHSHSNENIISLK